MCIPYLCAPHTQGYSNAQLYNGEYIANTTSTILVTVNYRLGAMGFLVYGDDGSGPRGNYGLRVSLVTETETCVVRVHAVFKMLDIVVVIKA